MVDALDNKMKFKECNILFYLMVDGEKKRISFETNSWSVAREKILNIEKQIQSEGQQGNRSNIIRTFRQPEYMDKQPMPDFSPPKRQLTREQIDHIVKNLGDYQMKKEISANKK